MPVLCNRLHRSTYVRTWFVFFFCIRLMLLYFLWASFSPYLFFFFLLLYFVFPVSVACVWKFLGQKLNLSCNCSWLWILNPLCHSRNVVILLLRRKSLLRDWPFLYSLASIQLDYQVSIQIPLIKKENQLSGEHQRALKKYFFLEFPLWHSGLRIQLQGVPTVTHQCFTAAA